MSGKFKFLVKYFRNFRFSKKLPESNFFFHIQAMKCSSIFNERPIEKVTIVSDKNVGSNIQNMIKPFLYQSQLIGFVENYKLSLKLRFGSVLKIFHIQNKQNSKINFQNYLDESTSEIELLKVDTKTMSKKKGPLT